MDSKHGGSPASGIVVPIGTDRAQPVAPGSVILEPEIAKENRNAKDRALQFERRRLALAVLPSVLNEPVSHAEAVALNPVSIALEIADDLLKQTGGHV